MEVIERLRTLGAEIREVSVPLHRFGMASGFVSVLEGQTANVTSFGNGYHHRGRYAPDVALALGKGFKSFGSELPSSLKMTSIVGNYLRE